MEEIWKLPRFGKIPTDAFCEMPMPCTAVVEDRAKTPSRQEFPPLIYTNGPDNLYKARPQPGTPTVSLTFQLFRIHCTHTNECKPQEYGH